MNKKIKKIILGFCTGLMFATTLILSIVTITTSQQNSTNNNSGNDNNDNIDNSNDNNSYDPNEDYPETSEELKNLKYPFDNSNYYLYMYANIHNYFYNNPEWDNLISYRYLLSDYNNHYQQFTIQEDVLFKNIKSWITKAIYQHPFFKSKSSKLTIEIDYKINKTQKNILINVVWYFENDYSNSKNLPKRYWDQIIVELSKNV